MQTFELAPPTDVPADLAAPTPAYVRHARLAFLGVVLFLVVYLGLTAWFGAAVWRLTFAAPPEDRVLGFFISLPALFLFGFLLTAAPDSDDPTCAPSSVSRRLEAWPIPRVRRSQADGAMTDAPEL